MERYYSNTVQAHSGPYDLTLDFGQTVVASEVEYDVRVSMSWEHAVSLVLVLQRLIENYQEQLGPLPDITSKLKILQAEGETAGKEEK
jgi:hypothetical protein